MASVRQPSPRGSGFQKQLAPAERPLADWLTLQGGIVSTVQTFANAALQVVFAPKLPAAVTRQISYLIATLPIDSILYAIPHLQVYYLQDN